MGRSFGVFPVARRRGTIFRAVSASAPGTPIVPGRSSRSCPYVGSQREDAFDKAYHNPEQAVRNLNQRQHARKQPPAPARGGHDKDPHDGQHQTRQYGGRKAEKHQRDRRAGKRCCPKEDNQPEEGEVFHHRSYRVCSVPPATPEPCRPPARFTGLLAERFRPAVHGGSGGREGTLTPVNGRSRRSALAIRSTEQLKTASASAPGTPSAPGQS
jgi:hypothetical protein